jgi:hypothetical protein
MIFKASFDELVEDVGRHELRNVRTGEVVGERLVQYKESIRYDIYLSLNRYLQPDLQRSHSPPKGQQTCMLQRVLL